jgi:chemotaxis family two-component system sensor histidine kinase/response regulator PixL
MAKVVLIIEDSESCAETLLIALESVPGLEPRVMKDTQAALKALEEGTGEIAAVVTDLHFPESSGFELIRRLRAEPRYAQVPILLVSGDSDPRLPERALSMGANAFFSKPYSPYAVRKKLEQLLC